MGRTLEERITEKLPVVPAPDERRQHPRHELAGQAEVRFTNWTVFKLLYTVNISKGGMNIELAESPAVGARLKVRLILPDGWPFEIDAAVRHVTLLEASAGLRFKSRFQIGVEFENLDAEHKAAIEETIRKHATHPP